MTEKTTSAQPGDMPSGKDESLLAANAPAPQSWGEKYGHGTLLFLRNVIVNYAINFMIGAVIAYKFDTSKFGGKINGWIEIKSQKSVRVSHESAKFMWKLPTRNQFLLMGGHILLPVMKYMKDHEQEMTLHIEHRLDKLQEFFGRGNEASKHNLAEYKHIAGLLDAAARGETPMLTDEDKKLLAKHEIHENLHFKEHTESWGRIIKARLIGITCSTAASWGLGWLSGQKRVALLRYEHVLEKPFGKWAADNIITKTPGLRSWFAKDPTLMGRYFIADSILTIPSAGIYRMVEKADEKSEALKHHHEEAVKHRREEREKKKQGNHNVSNVTAEGRIDSRDTARDTAAEPQRI